MDDDGKMNDLYVNAKQNRPSLEDSQGERSLVRSAWAKSTRTWRWLQAEGFSLATVEARNGIGLDNQR